MRIFVGLAKDQASQLEAMSPEELAAYVAEKYGMTDMDPENFRRHKFLSGVVPENTVESVGAADGVEWVEIDSVMKAF